METQHMDDIYDSDEYDLAEAGKGPVLARLFWEETAFELYEGDNIVGRNDMKKLDVRLADETVSDVHANLELDVEGNCHCKDLASNNGTYVESSSGSDNFIHVRRSKKILVGDQCAIKFGKLKTLFSLINKNGFQNQVQNELGMIHAENTNMVAQERNDVKVFIERNLESNRCNLTATASSTSAANVHLTFPIGQSPLPLAPLDPPLRSNSTLSNSKPSSSSSYLPLPATNQTKINLQEAASDGLTFDNNEISNGKTFYGQGQETQILDFGEYSNLSDDDYLTPAGKEITPDVNTKRRSNAGEETQMLTFDDYEEHSSQTNCLKIENSKSGSTFERDYDDNGNYGNRRLESGASKRKQEHSLEAEVELEDYTAPLCDEDCKEIGFKKIGDYDIEQICADDITKNISTEKVSADYVVKKYSDQDGDHGNVCKNYCGNDSDTDASETDDVINDGFPNLRHIKASDAAKHNKTALVTSASSLSSAASSSSAAAAASSSSSVAASSPSSLKMAEVEAVQIRSGSPSYNVDSDAESVDFLCPDYGSEGEDEDDVAEERSRKNNQTPPKALVLSLLGGEKSPQSALRNLSDNNSGQKILLQFQEKEIIVDPIYKGDIDGRDNEERKIKDDAIKEKEKERNEIDLSQRNKRDAEMKRDEEEGTLLQAEMRRQEEDEEETKKLGMTCKGVELVKEMEIGRLQEEEMEMQHKRKRETEEGREKKADAKKGKIDDQIVENKEEKEEREIDAVLTKQEDMKENREQEGRDIKTKTNQQEDLSGQQGEEKRLAELGTLYWKDTDVPDDEFRQMEVEKHTEPNLQENLGLNEKNDHVHGVEDGMKIKMAVGVHSVSLSNALDSKKELTRSSGPQRETIQNLKNVPSSSSSSSLPSELSINEDSEIDCKSNSKLREKDKNEAFNVLVVAATSIASPNTIVNINMKATRKSKRRDDSDENDETLVNTPNSMKNSSKNNDEIIANFIDDESDKKKNSKPVEIPTKKIKITRGVISDFFPQVVTMASASDEIITKSNNNKDDNSNDDDDDDADDRLGLIDKTLVTADTSASLGVPMLNNTLPLKLTSKPSKNVKNKKDVPNSIEKGNDSTDHSGNRLSTAQESEEVATEKVEIAPGQSLNNKKISQGGTADKKLKNRNGEEKAEGKKLLKLPEKKVKQEKVAVETGKVEKEDVEKVDNEEDKSAQLEKEDKGKENSIQIMNTGVTYKEGEFEQFALDIGVAVAKGPHTATHLITLDFIKRTPKFMIAINSGVKYVVTDDWLSDSVLKKKAVPITTLKSKYIVKDTAKEKLWGFKLADTLAIDRSNPQSGVFSTFSFFITDGVAGENAPQEDEIRNIIESGGGSWIQGVKELDKFLEEKKSHSAVVSTSSSLSSSSSSLIPANAKNTRISNTGKSSNDQDSLLSSSILIESSSTENNSNKLIVISSEKALKLVSTTVQSILKDIWKLEFLTGDGIFCMEILFLGVLRQKISFEQIHRLDCSFFNFVDNGEMDVKNVKKAIIRKGKK